MFDEKNAGSKTPIEKVRNNWGDVLLLSFPDGQPRKILGVVFFGSKSKGFLKVVEAKALGFCTVFLGFSHFGWEK